VAHTRNNKEFILQYGQEPQLGTVVIDNRGQQQVIVLHNVTSNAVSTNSTESDPAAARSTHAKDQVVVTEASEGLTVTVYVMAVGKVTDPSNIRFVSRISLGRVCMQLCTKQIAEELTTKFTKISINNVSLEFKPIIARNKRVILCNVCPIIPNAAIEERLAELGVKPTSQISYLRAGISDSDMHTNSVPAGKCTSNQLTLINSPKASKYRIRIRTTRCTSFLILLFGFPVEKKAIYLDSVQ
jgi:hypothetical protein